MDAKEHAARSAVAQVQSGQILGLGTGSTANRALHLLAERIRTEKLDVIGVPTSLATQRECEKLGIPLTDLEQNPRLDVAFDGADQVDARLNAIKGYGGALLREKIVARCARRFLVMVDSSKLTENLNKAVPVEVLPFGAGAARQALVSLGGRPQLRVAEGKPYVSDNGNLIFDVEFGVIEEPAELAERLARLPAVIDHGLFVGLTSELHVGDHEQAWVLYPISGA